MEELKEHLEIVDDVPRWLNFFGSAIEDGNDVPTAITLADEAYINDFPDE